MIWRSARARSLLRIAWSMGLQLADATPTKRARGVEIVQARLPVGRARLHERNIPPHMRHGRSGARIRPWITNQQLGRPHLVAAENRFGTPCAVALLDVPSHQVVQQPRQSPSATGRQMLSHHDNYLAWISKTPPGKPRLRDDIGRPRRFRRGNVIIVIDPNVDRLLFLLTAAFFAFAVAHTAHLLFG